VFVVRMYAKSSEYCMLRYVQSVLSTVGIVSIAYLLLPVGVVSTMVLALLRAAGPPNEILSVLVLACLLPPDL
jgi:hypothetical protein